MVHRPSQTWNQPLRGTPSLNAKPWRCCDAPQRFLSKFRLVDVFLEELSRFNIGTKLRLNNAGQCSKKNPFLETDKYLRQSCKPDTMNDRNGGCEPGIQSTFGHLRRTLSDTVRRLPIPPIYPRDTSRPVSFQARVPLVISGQISWTALSNAYMACLVICFRNGLDNFWVVREEAKIQIRESTTFTLNRSTVFLILFVSRINCTGWGQSKSLLVMQRKSEVCNNVYGRFSMF